MTPEEELKEFQKAISDQVLYLLDHSPKISSTEKGFELVRKAYLSALEQNNVLRDDLSKIKISWKEDRKSRRVMMVLEGPRDVLKRITLERAPEYELSPYIEVTVIVEK